MKAIFMDKDGTLIEHRPYNVNPERIVLMPGAAEAVVTLHQAGYRLFVTSNQAGVAHGYFPEAALEQVRERLVSLLAPLGVPLAGFYYCPHHPEGVHPGYAMKCICRKPKPGLILKAAWENGLTLANSWVVGDVLDDVEAGSRAGCRTVIIKDGSETEWKHSTFRIPDYKAADLADAARFILHSTPPGGYR